jgi:hypothetical protein
LVPRRLIRLGKAGRSRPSTERITKIRVHLRALDLERAPQPNRVAPPAARSFKTIAIDAA